MLFKRILLLAGALLLVSCVSRDLRQQEVRIPVADSNISLFATIFTPPGRGPFPVFILNHGTPATPEIRKRMGKWAKPEMVNALVERGFIVMIPMRRGFAQTGGQFLGGFSSCDDPDFYNSSLAAAEDILVAVRHVDSIPSADASKILLAGHSAGGIASIAAASALPKGVIAVVNFSGGRGSAQARGLEGSPCFPERMAETIARHARTIEIPVLWYYVENDRYFSPVVVRHWFESFTGGGGHGQLVIDPPFGKEGHFVLTAPGGSKHWGQALDRFLNSVGIPIPSTSPAAATGADR